MKNNLKIIIAIIITAVICISGTIYAETKINADKVSYSDTETVKDKIDDLYLKTNQIANKKFCKLVSGTKETVGSKYSCTLGEGIDPIDFYLLASNKDEVKLIMYKNLTGDKTMMKWYDAVTYLESGEGRTTVNKWTNVLSVDLPSAQDIANAVGNSSWKAATKTLNDWFCFGSKTKDYPTAEPYCDKTKNASYAWLFNYTKNCKVSGCDDATSLPDSDGYPYGYWTRDILSSLNGSETEPRAWNVRRDGRLHGLLVSNANRGVRPVITVLKSNLYE